MIGFGKWRAGAVPVARVQVTHHLTRDDAARHLIQAVLPDTAAEAREMSRTEISRVIREQLALCGSRGADFWSDEYAAEYDRELTMDEAEEWARRQVAKLLREREGRAFRAKGAPPLARPRTAPAGAAPLHGSGPMGHGPAVICVGSCRVNCEKRAVEPTPGCTAVNWTTAVMSNVA